MNVRTPWFVLLFLLSCAEIVLGQSRVDEHPSRIPEASRLVNPPGLALVLSGGAAKGFAHIGVLEILDSAHVPIDLIVGTSIGAAIGGLYAAGYTPAQLEHFAETTNWNDVLDLEDEAHRTERVLSQKDADNALLSLRFTGFFHPVIPQAVSSGQRLTMLLNSMVLNAPFGVPEDFLRDLRVPFVAVTTDIVSGECRLVTHGDLTEAMRASATLPLRFSPLPQDSAILMDGGLLANIPVDIARSFGALRVVVSNTTAKLLGRDALNTPWDVADQVISLMMQRQNAEQLKHADLIIAPQVNQLGNNDFSSIPPAIEAGREAARLLLPEIQQLLAAQNRIPSDPGGKKDTLLSVLREVRVIGTLSTKSATRFRDTVRWFAREYLNKALIRSGNIKDLERALLQVYRSTGFSLARIDSVIIRPSVGRADFFIDEGHIGSIQVHSDNSVPTEFALHEIPLSTGDVFRARYGEEALRNLTGTGLFDFATLQISYDSLWPGTRYFTREDTLVVPSLTLPSYTPKVQVTVRGRARSVIRLGVLADNEFGAQFSSEFASEDIAGSGIEASLKGGVGPLSRFASFRIDAPRLLSSFALLRGEVYSSYKDINLYSLETITLDNRITSSVADVVRESRNFGVKLQAGGQIERLGAVTAEIRHEDQEWFSVRTGSAGIDHLQLTAVRGDLVVDSRNDAAYPHTGTLVRGYIEEGIPALGGQASYTKVDVQVQQALPLSRLHTVIPRVRIGFGDSPIPRLEQFELGGMESFYGLNEYELRGKQMVEGSLTYQIAIPHVLFFPTFVSVRYDLGAMWPKPEQIKFESLLHGIGAQVGVKTPVGLTRFGIGENFRFNADKPHPIDLNSPRFYFSIGSNL